MGQENAPGQEIEDWLEILGLERLSEWDVLVFLYRHQASLVGAEHIAQLVGYATSVVVAALERLESLALVERSRVCQAVRLYQFIAPTDPRRGDAWDQLLTAAQSRAGRLLLTKKLRPNNLDRSDNGFSRLHLGGGAAWLKAI